MSIDERMEKEITPQELNKWLDNEENLTLIDIRKEEDYHIDHIPNAIHIPLSELENRTNEIPKSKKTVVYCYKGLSGKSAQATLYQNNFPEVYNLSGGFNQFERIKGRQ